jgi:uncharacterized protein (DUF849 family)
VWDILSNMTFKEIVNKYPIINTDWECSIMEVTNINSYDTLKQDLGIVGYFTRIRKDDGSSVMFNCDPWMREFKMYYTRRGIKNGIYECTRIDGVNGGNDVYIMVTSVEGSRVWCMDVFER